MAAMRFLFLVTAIGCFTARPVAAQSKEEPPKLEPWTQTYVWEEFTLSKESPVSGDGRYRLKSVRKNGEVELFYSPTPEQKEVIVVKPMPTKFAQGERLPTIVVKVSDAARQSATLRALKTK